MIRRISIRLKTNASQSSTSGSCVVSDVDGQFQTLLLPEKQSSKLTLKSDVFSSAEMKMTRERSTMFAGLSILFLTNSNEQAFIFNLTFLSIITSFEFDITMVGLKHHFSNLHFYSTSVRFEMHRRSDKRSVWNFGFLHSTDFTKYYLLL